MGVPPGHVADVFACLAGILHLGNLAFTAPPSSPELGAKGSGRGGWR